MNIQGFQNLSLLDFPGKVACTVFTGGCNLRCPFCHNAGLVNNPLESPNAEQDVLQYLSTRRGLLDGVCITGGEPLLQPDVEEFIKRIKSFGFLVKLDTNGYMPQKLKAILGTKLVDYVAMDIKSSLKNYSKATGCDIDTQNFILSVEIIKNSNIEHEFRTTAVAQLHRFVKAGYRQIVTALRLQHAAYLHRTVTVSIGLHHAQKLHAPTNMGAEGSVVVAQSIQIDLRPSAPQNRIFHG